MATTAQQINDALHRYYTLMGVKYNNEFIEFIEDNGFDDLEEEMQTTPHDCMLLDFDDNVPFRKEPDDRAVAVFDLLLKIYNDPKCDFQAEDNEFTPLTLTKKDFKLDKELIKHVKDLHKQQCTTIWTGEMTEDNSIIHLLTISHKLQTPYLIYLADLYNRDRLTADYDGHSLRVTDWIQENKHCKELRKMDAKHCDTAQAAVHGFFHRVVPKLVLRSTSRIDDSLEATARYINAEIEFVHKTAKGKSASCPFQLDACIIYNNVKRVQNAASLEDDIDTDQDEVDSEEDDPENKEFEDSIGNIKYKLATEKLLHEIAVFDEGDDEKSAGRRMRVYTDQFRAFKMKIIESRGKAMEDYPRNHRFCSLIDRRLPISIHADNDVVDKDEIIFYEPPDDCKEIPKQQLPLWYFDSGQTCIIPNAGYVENKKSKDPMQGIDEETGKQNITAGFGASGALLMLSFHVESVNEIRTYLFLNGQSMRFFPEDIVELLPRFFVDNEKNRKFVAGKRVRDLIAEMKPKLRDKRFESFYNKWGKVKSQKSSKKPAHKK